LKLEDALFQRSHRLLLRCSSSNNGHREIFYKDNQLSSRSKKGKANDRI
jgi:hypothetical protein